MRVRSWMSLVGIVAFSALSTSGCTADFTGDEGNIEFEYEATGIDFDGRPPIAVGSDLEVRGRPVEADSPEESPDAGTTAETTDQEGDSEEPSVTFTSVISSDPEVISVESVADSTFVLSAEAEGSVVIDVGATSEGDELTDKFRVEAAEIEEVTLAHRCTTNVDDSTDVAYFTGQNAHVRYTMSNGDDPLAGYGAYPVDVEGSTDLAIDEEYTRVAFLQFETGSTAGEASLNPSVDGDPLAVELVEPADAEAFSWPQRDSGGGASSGAFDDVPVDGVRYVHPRFEVGDRTVCQAAPELEVTNETEEVCAVEVVEEFEEEVALYRTLNGAYLGIEVRGKEEGTCSFGVSMPAASLEETLEVDVVAE